MTPLDAVTCLQSNPTLGLAEGKTYRVYRYATKGRLTITLQGDNQTTPVLAVDDPSALATPQGAHAVKRVGAHGTDPDQATRLRSHP